jgi:hypothetical protein
VTIQVARQTTRCRPSSCPPTASTITTGDDLDIFEHKGSVIWDMLVYTKVDVRTSRDSPLEYGGDVLLRERVAVLDDDQRQLLREALDDAAVAQTG